MADDERPSGTTAGTLMVVSGAFNLLWSGGVWSLCLGPLAVVPVIAGIAEMVVGSAILGRNPHERVRLVSILGMVAGLLAINPVSVGLEIASLVSQSRGQPKQIEGPR